MRRPLFVVLSLLLLSITPAAGQRSQGGRGTVVIVTPREAETPVPTLFGGDAANREVSDLIFLRLADLPADLATTDEGRFIPRLAKSWRRRDSTTIVFELDPRAHWQDGAPVTPADVIFTFDRARNENLDPQLAGLVRRIRSVTAEGTSRVVFQFTTAYSEQMYDAVYHAPPLPSHLLARMPPESLTTSDFIAHPVGNGPFRWDRRAPHQSIELAADDQFFLGAPRLHRVVFLIARDPEARVNLLLGGDADVVDNVYQFDNPERVLNDHRFQEYPLPSLSVGYFLMNQRDPADTNRPHPILGDSVVRHALVLALDRSGMVRAVLGPSSLVPSGPVSSVLANRLQAPQPDAVDTAAARRLLASRGWVDRDGDGVLDKDGRPLKLTAIFPSTSGTRRRLALLAQEQFRLMGIELELTPLDPPVYTPTRRSGAFDLDLNYVTQDPTPSGLAQSWACSGIGGTNVAHYCNPEVDSLLARASRSGPDSRRLWRQAVSVIVGDAPAIFLYAPIYVYAVDARFENVSFRPDSPWSDVWRWAVRAGRELPRDRQ
jgi:peptide/nickel transport system substrate-binding protein